MNKRCPKCGCFLEYVVDWNGDEVNVDYYKCNNKNCDWHESDEQLIADY